MTKSEISIWCLCFGVIGLLFVLDGQHPSVALKEEKLASSEPLEDMNCPDISVTLGIAGAREAYRQYVAGVDECTGRRELSHIIGVDKSDPIVKEATINRYMNYPHTQH